MLQALVPPAALSRASLGLLPWPAERLAACNAEITRGGQGKDSPDPRNEASLSSRGLRSLLTEPWLLGQHGEAFVVELALDSGR